MKIAKLLCGVAFGGFLASNAMAADLLYSQPAPAAPLAYGGPYVGIKGGVNFDGSDATLAADGAGTGVGFVDISRNTGFDVGVVAGYAFGSRFGMFSPRLEAELGYLSNDIDTLSFFNNTGTGNGTSNSDSSEINATYGLVNLLLDIPLGYGLTPFIGGGVGYANVRFDNISNDVATGSGSAGAGTVFFDDEDTAFAYSLTAGVSYDISRNVTLEVAYRYLSFTNVQIRDNTAALGTTNVTEDDIDNHQVNVGLRVHL